LHPSNLPFIPQTKNPTNVGLEHYKFAPMLRLIFFTAARKKTPTKNPQNNIPLVSFPMIKRPSFNCSCLINSTGTGWNASAS